MGFKSMMYVLRNRNREQKSTQTLTKLCFCSYLNFYNDNKNPDNLRNTQAKWTLTSAFEYILYSSKPFTNIFN